MLTICCEPLFGRALVDSLRPLHLVRYLILQLLKFLTSGSLSLFNLTICCESLSELLESLIRSSLNLLTLVSMRGLHLHRMTVDHIPFLESSIRSEVATYFKVLYALLNPCSRRRVFTDSPISLGSTILEAGSEIRGLGFGTPTLSQMGSPVSLGGTLIWLSEGKVRFHAGFSSGRF